MIVPTISVLCFGNRITTITPPPNTDVVAQPTLTIVHPPNTAVKSQPTLTIVNPPYTDVVAQSDLTIVNISDNINDYQSSNIPKYDKFEITLDIENTVASNLQVPFDPALDTIPGMSTANPYFNGISVDGIFLPPGKNDWDHDAYIQPAFYYQDFDHQVKGDLDWIYPKDQYSWRIRFAPNQTGQWQYKIRAQDSSNHPNWAESPIHTFTVSDSNNPGFIKVSKNDARYFEFDNGSYFPALGYNLNYRRIDWVNPIQANQQEFSALNQNGVQLIRTWLTFWGINPGSEPWKNYVGFSPLNFEVPFNGSGQPAGNAIEDPQTGSQLYMRLLGSWNRCVVWGWESAPMPLRRNATYQIDMRYKIKHIAEPSNPSLPHGLTIKLGGWNPHNNNMGCDNPEWGQKLIPSLTGVDNIWKTVSNTFNAPDSDFTWVHVALENLPDSTPKDNTDQTEVYIDTISIREVIGSGQLGPNIVTTSDMDTHYSMQQRNSYALDRVLELAEQNDIYFKFVINEKGERYHNLTNFLGESFEDNDVRCTTDENYCMRQDHSYGNWHKMTKVRWLQQAWWRYLQARWGYSTAIHSWELFNEGDPFHSAHYTLTDELGKFMHCRAFDVSIESGYGQKCNYNHPNDHLVTTSTWHSYPRDQFWNNPDYPNIDYADIHQYLDEDDPEELPYFNDAALFTQNTSMSVGALQSNGSGKPIMRGETGFIFTNMPDGDLLGQNADGGLWLHNYIWGGINSGGFIESFWNSPPTQNQIDDENSGTGHDHRHIFKKYLDFIEDIPMNNGHYTDVDASLVNGSPLRVWGQKDTHNNHAHIWIQNPQNTWRNKVDNKNPSPISDTITISGFSPNTTLHIQWYDTYTGSPASTQTLTTDAGGNLSFTINNLTTDTAVKVGFINVQTEIYLPIIVGD